MILLLSLLLTGAYASPADGAAPEPARLRRFAIIVGANKAPPGRQPLRFAHKDAERMKDALISVGRFAEADVRVLSDPKPEFVLGALDAATYALQQGRPGDESLLLFYYSGHADMQAIYPNGDALAMEAIKKRLEESKATVRIGMLDACRGGAWTGAKGLVNEAPFDLSSALGLNNEGSVFIASSSGMEDAHESEVLTGSFFTHHFVAAMRGAADASNDGEITLGEAYNYAQALTVRDSAIAASQPQHPSFEMNLKGQTDLTIAELKSAPSSLEVSQDAGPLEVIHLGSGVIVLELPQGARSVRAALPPGRYLVRLRTPFGTRARAVEITAGTVVAVHERDLLLAGSAALAAKSLQPDNPFPRPQNQPYVTVGAPPPEKLAKPLKSRRPWIDLTLATGLADGLALFAPVQPGIHVITGVNGFSFSIASLLRITERFRWAIGTIAFDYRFGELGRFEIMPSAGVLHWGFGSPSKHPADWYAQIYAVLAAGLDGRFWVASPLAIAFSLRASTAPTLGQIGPAVDPLASVRKRGTDTWQFGAAAGLTVQLAKRAELSLGLAYSLTPFDEGRIAAPIEHVISIGSVLYGGLVPRPLASVTLTDFLQLVLHAGVAIPSTGRNTTGWGTVGFAFVL